MHGCRVLAALLLVICGCQVAPPQAAPAPKTLPGAAASVPQGLAPPMDPTEVTLTFALPHGEVAQDAMGAVGFSEPMVALTALDTPTSVPNVTVTPAVPLRWQWLGTNTLGFHPLQPLPGSTTFTVTVAPGLKALSGRELRRGQTWTFRTPRAHVVASLPGQGFQDVEHKPLILLVFDQPIDLGSVRQALKLSAGGKVLDFRAQLATGKTLQAALAALERQRIDALQPGEQLAGRLVLFSPVKPLPAGAKIAVHLAPGVRGLQGPELGETAFDLEFKTFGTFAVTTATCENGCDPDAYSPVRVEFSNELAREDIQKFIHLSPPVADFRASCWGRQCSPGGTFAPARRYTLTLDAGLTDAHGQKLRKPFTFTFTTGHRRPLLSWATEGEVLERHARPLRVGVDARNLTQVQARLLPLPETGVTALLASAEVAEPPPMPKEALTIALRAPQKQDQSERRVFDFDKLLNGKPGIAVLDVWSPQFTGQAGRPHHLRRVFQVTDLHVDAKVADRNTIVWVTSYATGKPVAGVKIDALGLADRLLRQGTTDANGLATVAGLDVSREEAQPVLVARKDGDRAILRLGDTERQQFYGDDVQTPWPGEHVAQARPWLFLDKGVYRLGETVHVKGVVRKLAAQGGLELPDAGTPVTVTLTDPTGHETTQTASKLSKQGTFHVALTVPAQGTYGSWEIKATTQGESVSESFRVLVYRAPKFRMATQIAQKHAVRGDSVAVTTEAAWYSGGPLAGAPLKFSAWGSPSRFAPPGWPEFDFSMDEQEVAPGAVNSLSQDGKGQLDGRGQAQFHVGTQVALDRPLHVDVEATVLDPNGNPVAAQAGFWLHPAAVSVGAALPTSVLKVGEPLTARLVAVTAEGQPVPGTALQGQWLRQDWKSVRVQAMGGQVDWQVQRVETPVGTCKVTSAVQPSVCTRQFDQPGQYSLRVQGTDRQGRLARASTSLYVVGPGVVTWAPPGADPGPMLVADKASYQVGDTARILVKNPVPGAWALVTEEQGHVLRTRIVTLASGAQTIEVPIEARHQPDVFVSVVVFAGRRSPIAVAGQDTGAPQLQLGYVALHVQTEDRKLRVEVLPSAANLGPGASIDVAVQVRDSKGQPRPAEVTLWAVDEGVLALTAAQTPDPMQALYAKTELGVRNYAAIENLVRGRVGEEKGADGGGGGAAAFRGKFRDVAFYADALQAGPDGIARGHFTLPDNLTTFRLMAVAIDGPSQFGSADKAVKVSKPLMLLTSLPHAVQVGDRFELAATLRNTTAQALDGTLSLEVGAGLKVLGAATRPVQAVANGSREETFTVVAEKPGTPTIALKVQAGPHGDALIDTLLVTDPRPLESTATYGLATATIMQTLQKSTRAHEDVGGLTVTLASTGLAGLQSGLQWLVQYPYGCTEQVASGLLALLYVEQFSRDFKLFPDKAKTTPGLIDAAIGRLLAMRGAEPGAFALWPDAARADAEATAWALTVLHEADARGHRVDPTVFREGAAYLRAKLDAKQGQNYHNEVQFDSARALYLAALADIGHADAGYLAQVLANRGRLPADAQLLLGRAAALGGQKAQALAVLDDLTRQLHLDGEMASLPQPRDPWLQGLWPSEVRTNALLLDLMLRVQPDHPLAPKVARWLIGQRHDDRWATTQDNAWALRALTRWFEQVEKTAPDFDLDVQLAGKSLGKGAFHQRTFESVQTFTATRDLPAGTVPLVLRKQGAGVLYYGMRYTYSPKGEAEVARNAGLLVRRTVIDGQGQTGRTEFERGEQVMVLVTVVADATRNYVAIVDRLPAGLEPVDFQLATSSEAVQRQFAAVSGARQGLATEQASFREFAKGEVRFFMDELSPGLHTFGYVARATTRGQFTAHGARAEAMYNPEVFGTSGPIALTVK